MSAENEFVAQSPRVMQGERILPTLLTLWSQALANVQVGADDSFFDIGGDSLRAMRVASGVRREFGVVLSLGNFFEYDTARRQAAHIESLLEKRSGKD